MDVSIIIVNYNTYTLTIQCIDSIFEKTKDLSFEVILVDNASTDNSRKFFQQDKRIKYIRSDENLGFGKANNLGYKRAIGKYIFLLNSDTVLKNNAVKIFFDAAEKSPANISCWGSLLLNANNQYVHSFSKFPTISYDLYCEFIKVPLHKFFGLKLTNNQNESNIKKSTIVDYITGADLFIRNSVVEKYGLFDPVYFMYYEETDLQKRYKDNGFHSQLILGPEIIHLEGGSQGKKKKDLKRSLLILQSKLYYLKKWNNPYSYFCYRLLLLIFRIPFLILSHYKLSEKKQYLKLLLS